jgi:hypothetical protein
MRSYVGCCTPNTGTTITGWRTLNRCTASIDEQGRTSDVACDARSAIAAGTSLGSLHWSKTVCRESAFQISGLSFRGPARGVPRMLGIMAFTRTACGPSSAHHLNNAGLRCFLDRAGLQGGGPYRGTCK